MSAKILGCLLLALCLAGCTTLRPTGKSVGKEEQREAMRYFIRAKVFESQGNFMAAIVALRNAADLDPSSATIFAQLAYNYKRIDDLKMAIEVGENQPFYAQWVNRSRMLLEVRGITG